MADDTVIVFCSDHGEMLGERGLWFKMSFFEGSARVPLMIAGANVPAGLVTTPVSNLDICPTLCDIAGVDMGAVMPWTDGQSLKPLTEGAARTEPVLMEYAAEGSYAPMVAIRDGRYKFIHCELDPPQLFDLETDPLERDNLAGIPAHAGLVETFMAKVSARWDMAAFDAAVRESQARRWVVYKALRNGSYFPWDFQPLQKASERYMRNHMNLDTLEGEKRFPRGE
jgi:choline-sulfatase